MDEPEKPNRAKRFLIGLGILLVGVLGFVGPILLRPDPPKEERTVLAPLVTTTVAETSEGPMVITADGTVRSTREVALSAEVAGRVIWTSPKLVTGGVFSRGQTMVRIDTTDYLNAVQVAQAAVTQRRVELLQAKEESDLARSEWERLQARRGTDEQPQSGALGSLAFREPQVRLAEAALTSAKAQLADAEARMARTRVRAPFNGKIRAKVVELGQYVAPGQQLLTLYGTDQVEVSASLTEAQSALIPGLSSGTTERFPATVRTDGTASWDGYVHRLEGLDPSTRTYRVVVRVDRPYRADPPLLVDAFASIDIFAGGDEAAIRLPEQAVRDGNRIWVVNEGTLEMRDVEVLQRRDGQALIKAIDLDLPVITSPLEVVTEGMKVRTSS